MFVKIVMKVILVLSVVLLSVILNNVALDAWFQIIVANVILAIQD